MKKSGICILTAELRQKNPTLQLFYIAFQEQPKVGIVSKENATRRMRPKNIIVWGSNIIPPSFIIIHKVKHQSANLVVTQDHAFSFL